VTHTIATAIAAGLGYLEREQAGDGFWSDWQLPPGPSQVWTTAYVGWRLSGLPLATASAAPRLDRAAAWLRTAACADGGWGYGAATGPDADTTALATAFLRHRGIAAAHAVPRLLAHQQADGGFATYTRAWNHGAWTHSHPEVTAAAVVALTPEAGVPLEALQAGRRYLHQVRGDDGLWPSYWWTTPLYATEAALACVGPDLEPARRQAVAAVVATPTPTCFEAALQVSCLVQLAEIEAASARLGPILEAQAEDGSWPSGRVLRLTHRHVEHPWRVADAGPLFADDRRTFSTATVVAALSAVDTRAPRR
jgi:hypothetical protein